MQEETIEEEVDRRLERIGDEPERLRRYDRDGDGEIDDDEWEAVRRLVAAEVRTERRRRRDAPSLEGDAGPEIDDDRMLRDRYELRRILGRGGQGITYLAWDLHEEELVAVKARKIGSADDWKDVELFEREAETLEALDHPAVPDYVDHWHVEGETLELYLVQEFVDGESLEQLVTSGERLDVEQVRDVVEELLDILEDLHGREPPVVHRDIKPSNVIRRPDGRLALIDFGAVQRVAPDDRGGSTIVGTSGYMPLEQLMAEAEPATDIYAVAATAVFLATATHPADLPLEGMVPEFRDRANLPEWFAVVLEKMLAPEPDDRLAAPDEIRRRLEGEGSTDTESFDLLARHRRDEPVEHDWRMTNFSLADTEPLEPEPEVAIDGAGVPGGGLTFTLPRARRPLSIWNRTLQWFWPKGLVLGGFVVACYALVLLLARRLGTLLVGFTLAGLTALLLLLVWDFSAVVLGLGGGAEYREIGVELNDDHLLVAREEPFDQFTTRRWHANEIDTFEFVDEGVRIRTLRGGTFDVSVAETTEVASFAAALREMNWI